MDDSLDAAWAEAEAALPIDEAGKPVNSSGGVWLSLERLNAQWYTAEWGAFQADADTPAAALRALAAKLRDA